MTSEDEVTPDRPGDEPSAPDGLLTVGHGTATQPELVDLLQEADVTSIVDVRRFPGSRRNPHVARHELASWLPAAGIGYRWEERLGGRRRGAPGSPHVGMRNDSFRAYADHLESTSFRTAVAEVLAEADRGRVAVMCSESVWWRCHRRLQPHPPTDVVRVEDGRLLYDGGTPTLDLGGTST